MHKSFRRQTLPRRHVPDADAQYLNRNELPHNFTLFNGYTG